MSRRSAQGVHGLSGKRGAATKRRGGIRKSIPPPPLPSSAPKYQVKQRPHGCHDIWTRFNAGRDDQQWFYRACVTALQDGRASIVRELDAAVQQLEQL